MPESIATAYVDLKVDPKGLKKGFTDAQRNVSSQGKKMEANMSKSLRGVGGSAKQASKSVGQLGTAMKSIANIVAAKMFIDFTIGSINFASKLSDLALQAGLTTDQLQTLNITSIKAGVSSDKVVSIMGKLAQATSEAKSGMATYTDSFDKAGVSTQELYDLNPAEILQKLAVTVKNSARGTEEFGAVMEILGVKTVPMFIEVLSALGSDGGWESLQKNAAKTGKILSEDLIQKLDGAADSIELLKMNMTASGGVVAGWILDGAESLGKLTSGLSAARAALGLTLFSPALLGGTKPAEPSDKMSSEMITKHRIIPPDAVDLTAEVFGDAEAAGYKEGKILSDAYAKWVEKNKALDTKTKSIEETRTKNLEAIFGTRITKLNNLQEKIEKLKSDLRASLAEGETTEKVTIYGEAFSFKTRAGGFEALEIQKDLNKLQNSRLKLLKLENSERTNINRSINEERASIKESLKLSTEALLVRRSEMQLDEQFGTSFVGGAEAVKFAQQVQGDHLAALAQLSQERKEIEIEIAANTKESNKKLEALPAIKELLFKNELQNLNESVNAPL